MARRTDNVIVVTRPPPLPSAPQLSPENLVELQRARGTLRKVSRAVSVASMDGWTIGTFAALTLVLGLTDPGSILMGLAMGTIAWVELRCAARLRRLDAQATRTLGFNQLALGAVLILYALWRIYSLFREGGASEALGASDPQVAQMLKPMEGLTRLIGLAVYMTLIAVGVFAQGGLAWFYFTREKHVRTYVAETPPWIVAMQRAGMSF